MLVNQQNCMNYHFVLDKFHFLSFVYTIILYKKIEFSTNLMIRIGFFFLLFMPSVLYELNL